jgi:uncharacterized protein (TIGR00299 family) protein
MTGGRLLYVDCIGGLAGDMLLGALLDAGASLDVVRSGLAGLGIEGLDVSVERPVRHGVTASRAVVHAPAEHVHRDWAAVREIVDRCEMPSRARERAQEAFRRLAVAEGRVHDVPPDRVHFHEVGAIDALADVCGTVLALEDLGIDRIVCSPLPVGRGFVDAAHGRLPLPAPATLEVLRGAPLRGMDVEVELVTPTGAALVAAVADGYQGFPDMTVDAVGYGAGTRDLAELPNLVRVVIGMEQATRKAVARRPMVLVECTVDDLPPELVPDAVERCRASGAVDVWVAPVQMKKGRPGIVITAIAPVAHEESVVEAMFDETTTLGVRTTPVQRWELEREQLLVSVAGQEIGVKLGRRNGSVLNVAPEHDDVARAAAALGRPVKGVWADALAAARLQLAGDDARR